MKVGLVCPYNLFVGGGVQECVFALQNELQKRGHEAKIITPLPLGTDNEHLKDVIIIGNAAKIKSLRTTPWLSVSGSIDAIDTMLETHNFDVLHFHEPWVPILSRQILTRSKAANVGTFHARLPETVLTPTVEKVITPYTKSIIRYLHAFSAVSDVSAEYVRSLTDAEVGIIPNGIDLQKYRAKSPNTESLKSSKSILYVGRLEKRKGLIYLLKAYQMLKDLHPEVKLVIAGDGVDRNKLENYANKYGIADIDFRGYVRESEKLRLFHESDLLCSPAIYGESFGIILLEAMATGLVAVAGNNDGYTGLMKGRGMLSLVDPANIGDFCRRLELLLYDEELRRLWREWAAEYVQQFSYTSVADQYEKLYLEARS